MDYDSHASYRFVEDPSGNRSEDGSRARSPSCAGVKSLPSTVAARCPSRSMIAVCRVCVISPSSAKYSIPNAWQTRSIFAGVAGEEMPARSAGAL